MRLSYQMLTFKLMLNAFSDICFFEIHFCTFVTLAFSSWMFSDAYLYRYTCIGIYYFSVVFIELLLRLLLIEVTVLVNSHRYCSSGSVTWVIVRVQEDSFSRCIPIILVKLVVQSYRCSRPLCLFPDEDYMHCDSCNRWFCKMCTDLSSVAYKRRCKPDLLTLVM